MEVFQFIKDWGGHITKVFDEHTLAGALVTLAAVGAFFWLQSTKKLPTLVILFILLLGWSIMVPVVGFIFDCCAKLGDFLTSTFGFIASIYAIYEKHPLIFIAVTILAVIFYFIWKKAWPNTINNKWARIIILIISTIVLMCIISPLADAINSTFIDKDSSTPAKVDSVRTGK